MDATQTPLAPFQRPDGTGHGGVFGGVLRTDPYESKSRARNVREGSSIGALKWGKWRLSGVRSRIPAQKGIDDGKRQGKVFHRGVEMQWVRFGRRALT